MKIGIDARFYGEAGPGRYVSQLLKNLETVDKENEYIIYLKRSNYELYVPVNPRFSKKLADFHWYSLAEQIAFPQMLSKENFDLVHFTQINVPFLYFKPFVVTIHDVILHEFSTERGGLIKRFVYRLKKAFYYLIFDKGVYASRSVIVPSETTKTDLLKYYRVNKEKIHVTLESVDHYPSSQNVYKNLDALEKYGIKKPYILALGSFYPHKNIDGLVRAYDVLRRSDIFTGQLVLVGKESYFSNKLRDLVKTNNIEGVVFPGYHHKDGYLPDEEVEPILANAYLYVQPALKEGFGIPPVEAMVFGVPTAVSKIPCLLEMCGGSTIYFDPTDVNDIVLKIGKGVTDSSLRSELVRLGLENVKKYSWNKMARETLEVYKSAVDKWYTKLHGN
jgi:glycosyltransferase involved in cell wall biosynthesis